MFQRSIALPRRLINVRYDLIAVLLLIGLWALGNWHMLTPTARDQWSVSGGDFSAHSLVYSSYAASRLSQGEIPLWWSNNYAGQPFFADPEAAAAYPVRWVMIALYGGQWGYGALQAEALLHLLMASLFTYACARMLGVGRLGAGVAAVVFAHSGLLNGYPIQQLHILESIIWLPLTIGLIHRAVTRASLASLLLAGASLGMALLAGHTQTALYMGYLAVAYLIYQAYFVQKLRWQVVLASVIVFGAITFLVSAVSLLPAVEFLPRTTRDADLNFAAKASGIGFGGLLDALYPGVVALFSTWYIGVTAWFLAVLGLYKRFWAGAALLTGLFAFGGNSILFSAVYWLLPGVSLFRNPERILLVTIFALSLLCGFGIQRIVSSGLSRRAWQFIIGGSAAITGITGVIALGVTLALLIGASGDPASRLDLVWYTLLICAMTLVVFGWSRFNRRPLIGAWALAALVAWDLLSWGTTHAVAYEPIPIADRLPPPAYLDPIETGTGRVDGARALTPYASLYGLQDIYGVSPLRLTSMAHLLDLPVDRFWELLAVRYVTSSSDTLPADSHVIAQGNDTQGNYYVHELTSPRPFAWLVYKVDINDNDEFARQIIADPRFDPRETVILPSAPAITLPDERPANATATITTYAPEHIEITVDTPENAILTLALPRYPGWQAQIDGVGTPIDTAYTALSAISIPAGQHTVTLSFTPMRVIVGALLSLVGWLLIGFAFWFKPERKWRALFNRGE